MCSPAERRTPMTLIVKSSSSRSFFCFFCGTTSPSSSSLSGVLRFPSSLYEVSAAAESDLDGGCLFESLLCITAGLDARVNRKTELCSLCRMVALLWSGVMVREVDASERSNVVLAILFSLLFSTAVHVSALDVFAVPLCKADFRGYAGLLCSFLLPMSVSVSPPDLVLDAADTLRQSSLMLGFASM